MGLYLELGFFVFLSTPFLAFDLAPKIRLVTVAICDIIEMHVLNYLHCC